MPLGNAVAPGVPCHTGSLGQRSTSSTQLCAGEQKYSQAIASRMAPLRTYDNQGTTACQTQHDGRHTRAGTIGVRRPQRLLVSAAAAARTQLGLQNYYQRAPIKLLRCQGLTSTPILDVGFCKGQSAGLQSRTSPASVRTRSWLPSRASTSAFIHPACGSSSQTRLPRVWMDSIPA